MGSNGDTTESTEASPAVVAKAIKDEPIGDEPNDNKDQEDISDEEPFFPFESRGKVVCPTAGNNTKSARTSKQIRDAKLKEEAEKGAQEKKTT